MSQIAKLTYLALACPLVTLPQTTSSSGTPVQIVVTLGHHYGDERPTLTRDDLIVTQVFEPLPITNLVPLSDDRAGLELFVLVDDSSNGEPGSKFEELRRFIGSQASTTAVGVAYIEGGHLRVSEKPTPDHVRAVKALSAPDGRNPSGPFNALTELIQGWPQGSSRRAVLMISNGVDPAATDVAQVPSAEAAIHAAQRAGVIVYAIYQPSADYLTGDPSKIHSGQIELAHLAFETGGEAYFLGSEPLPSLAPFLADMADHFANQYLLQFLPDPDLRSGAFQPVTVKSKLPDVELMAPGSVWIPQRRSGPPSASSRAISETH
jgi:hypothetical protein